MTKTLRVLVVVLAIAIGFYPATYFILDREFGLLSSKSDALLTDVFWNVGFYTHIILGGIALLIGWVQFSPKIRANKLALHRILGKIYVASVLMSALAGFYIGFFATGGLVASLGFMSLAVVWFSTTWLAYRYIRKNAVAMHQTLMVYSYAACFAAVMLRVWLPLLSMYFGEFNKAYIITAWLCWVPNMVVAYAINARRAIV